MLGFKWKPLTAAQEQQIVEAIAEAERKTSAEIRVHIDKWCKTDPLFKARNRFISLEMDKTKDRNGVLIYIALKEHKLAIIGDVGIDQKVSAAFWQQTVEHMLERIKAGLVAEGICAGIQDAGTQLAQFFPIQADDKNELSDDISYG